MAFVAIYIEMIKMLCSCITS